MEGTHECACADVRMYVPRVCVCVCVCVCPACTVPHAANFSLGCVVSTCNAGWKVNANESKCEANVCLCTNGVPPSGAACAVDGAKMCQSCVPGFKLNAGKTACDGMVEDYVYGGETGAYVCACCAVFWVSELVISCIFRFLFMRVLCIRSCS